MRESVLLLLLTACAAAPEPVPEIPTVPPVTRPPMEMMTPTSLETLIPSVRHPFTPEIRPTATIEAAELHPFIRELLAPMAEKAWKSRRERQAKNPAEWAHRINGELDQSYMLYAIIRASGETHEPPVTEYAKIGSETVVAVNIKTGKVFLYSITHDLRGITVEQHLQANNPLRKPQALWLSEAYNQGGFPLMRALYEDIYGAPIDFQTEVSHATIASLVDEVFGGLMVDVPMDFAVHPFYLAGKKYPADEFKQGKSKFDGKKTIQYMVTVPLSPPGQMEYNIRLEHRKRQDDISDAVIEAVRKNVDNKEFWAKAAGFMTKELAGGRIHIDFDIVSLLINNLSSLVLHWNDAVRINPAKQYAMPAIADTIYIVDPNQLADGKDKRGGVIQWATANAAVNPYAARDLASGVMAKDIEMPGGIHDPYGDPVLFYEATRRLFADVIAGR